MKKLTGLFAALALGGAVLTAPTAHAIVINGDAITLTDPTDIGQTFNVTLDCLDGEACNGGTNNTGVDVILDMAWTLFDVTSNGTNLTWIFDVTLTNNSSGLATIYSMGFLTDPNLTGSLINDGTIDWDLVNGFSANGNTNVPGFKVDTCLFGDNNCSGGDIKTGLAQGGTDTIRLALVGDLSNPVTLSGWAAKAQGVNGGPSYEFGAGNNCCDDNTQIPLPAAGFLLLGALGALGGLGAFRRRQTTA